MRDRGFKVSGDRPPDVSADTAVEVALHRARRRLAVLDGALEALAASGARAHSADGAVEVAVDGHGRLVSVAFAEAVTRMPAARIAELVVETTQAAARKASAHRQAVLGDVVADLGR